MSKQLPVPKELEQLIEKRDEDGDRRRGERRKRARHTAGGESTPKPERRQANEPAEKKSA